MNKLKKSTTLFMGGLGNMMFQAAMLYAYSKKYQYEHYLNLNHNGTLHKLPNSYRDNIFRNFKFTEVNSVDNWKVYEQPEGIRPCGYLELNDSDYEMLAFKGFFQSYKYFKSHEKEIQSLFSPHSEILIYLNEKYKPKSKVSIHIRRGDYVDLSEFHHNLNIDYYKNSIDYFRGSEFLVFSDDVEWCKKKLKGEEFTFVDGEADYNDLYLMSLCEHNIIANSTFSWWGAYLNTNSNKKVIYPNKWFGLKKQHCSVVDLFPDEWVGLSESIPVETINLMGSVCSHLTKPNMRWSTVHNKISSNLRIVRNEYNFDGISIFPDDVIESDLVHNVNSSKKIGWLIATREEVPARYNNFHNYKDKYEFTMTHDSLLISQYPDKTKLVPYGGCWIKDSNFNLYPKIKSTSMILSSKNYLSGHKIRHNISNLLQGSGVDFFGRGTNNPIENKEEGLIEYHFSIVVENSKTDNYFTEKLLDCFAVGTIPIYWGCDNIGNYFDTNGMLIFDSIEDMHNIIPLLTEEYYKSKLESISKNLELSKNYNITEDWIYQNIIKI